MAVHRLTPAEQNSPQLPPLSLGLFSRLVFNWQSLLARQEAAAVPTGRFDETTAAATERFQAAHKLSRTGAVDAATLRKAASLFQPELPALPDFWPILDDTLREEMFGSLAYRTPAAPTEPDELSIFDPKPERYLADVLWDDNSPARFNRQASRQFQSLMEAWKAKGLSKRILARNGAFVPRLKRQTADEAAQQRPRRLSNHAYGLAFDINADQNPYGQAPAALGELGCVFELVPVAHRFGFFWGGDFLGDAADGMHFEIAQVLTPDVLNQRRAEFGLKPL